MSDNGVKQWFNRLRKAPAVLHSPVVGSSIRLEDVPDQAFAGRMLGDGAAFVFEGDTVHAPSDAKVMVVAQTGHAIGLSVNGVDVLIHIGIDTAQLKGEGFTTHVSVGDKVAQGQLLVTLDRAYFASQGADLTTMMVITSPDTTCEVYEPANVTLASPTISL